MAGKYDVVVVGAGLAGLSAAKTAGENGLKVALVERQEDITQVKRSCSQMLIPLNEEYLGDRMIYCSKSKLIRFLKNGLSIRYDGPHRNVYGIDIYSFGGQMMKIGNAVEGRKRGDAARISASTIKSQLFKNMLEDAESAGVEVFPGVSIDDVKKTKDGVSVSGGGKTFAGTFVIGADGANSRLAQRLGYNKDRKYYSSMVVNGYYMKGLKVPDPNTVYYMVGQFKAAPVLCALVPRPAEKEHTAVFISLDVRVDLKAYHDFVVAETAQAPWFEGREEELALTSNNNMWSTILDPFKDNVLLVGDAIWCQESENSGALLSGGKAAHAVTLALLDGKPNREGVSSYLEWWKDAFVDRYPRDLIMANYLLGAVLTNEEADTLFRHTNETMPGSILPYTLPGYLGEAVGKAAPGVQGENPDVLAKLGRLQQETPDQILAEAASAGTPNR